MRAMHSEGKATEAIIRKIVPALVACQADAPEKRALEEQAVGRSNGPPPPPRKLEIIKALGEDSFAELEAAWASGVAWAFRTRTAWR